MRRGYTTCTCALRPFPHSIANSELAQHAAELQKSVSPAPSHDLPGLVTAAALADDGIERSSKLWTSPSDHSLLPSPSVPLTLLDAQASFSAIVASTETMSGESDPPPTASHPRTNAWAQRAHGVVKTISEEATVVLDSLQDNRIPANVDELQQLVTNASAFLDRGARSLGEVTHHNAQASKEATQSVLTAIHTRIEELAPRLPTPAPDTNPIQLDVSSHRSVFSSLDTVAQVMILLGVVCHWIIGLSTEPCEFIIGVASMLVKMAMTTYGPRPHSTYTPGQKIILGQLPTSLYTATNQFKLDGHTTTYAVCPSCNYTHNPTQDRSTLQTEYPVRCPNQLVGPTGLTPCNARLLNSDDASSTPLKPFVVQSFRHYLSDLLADGDIEHLCDQACDDALRWQSDPAHPCENEVFKGDFFRTFHGPDSQDLFLDRRGRMRLAFIMHVDFFNPNGTTNRGNHDSVGIISLALLNLPKHLRDKPENVFIAGVIPGPKEPPLDQLNHFIRPIIDEFEVGWKRGFHLPQTTASPEQGRSIDVAMVISTNDLPGARKVSGTSGVASHFFCTVCPEQGHHKIHNVDHTHWKQRDVHAMKQQAEAWRDACTTQEREQIFKSHGVRWSELWRLPYWDPTRMLVIDTMHCILEGLVHYHCRHVLCLRPLSRSSCEVTQPTQAVPAFTYPWVAYDPGSVPEATMHLNAKEEQHIALIQRDLSLAMDKTPQAIALLKKKLIRRNRKALVFVWKSLGLPSELTRLSSDNRTYVVHAKTKEHLAELLVLWRLEMPLTRSTPDRIYDPKATLVHIQRVIASTITPSWVHSVPKNYGDSAAGSIKADEWRTLSTLYIPIALVTLWNDHEGIPPDPSSSSLTVLDHSMALFQAVTVLCRYTMTPSRANDYRTYLTRWVQDLHTVHPHTAGHPPRVNVHAAFHIHDFLLLFGPVMSWWTFPFERMIGVLQKVNTNDKIGGPLEAAMLKSWARGANLRRWLRRPECPEIIRQFKALFDKAFGSSVTVNSSSVDNHKPQEMAHYVHHGFRYSRASTHLGNSLIFYYPDRHNASSAVGSIKKIYHDYSGRICCDVQRQMSLPPSKHDPFLRYPLFPAVTYSSKACGGKPDKIYFEDVIGHASRFDFSQDRSVFVNMSRA